MVGEGPFRSGQRVRIGPAAYTVARCVAVDGQLWRLTLVEVGSSMDEVCEHEEHIWQGASGTWITEDHEAVALLADDPAQLNLFGGKG